MKVSKNVLSGILLLIVIVADTMVTVYLLAKGLAYEFNPMMNWYIQHTSLELMAFTKISGSLILILWILKQGKSSKHLNWALPLYVFILILFHAIQLIRY